MRKLIFELGVVLGIQLLPKYIVPTGGYASSAALKVTILLWVFYLVWNHKYIWNLPKPVIVLALSHFACMGGYLSSGYDADLFFPLNNALFTLAIMGVFCQKYCERRNVWFISAVCIVLMPVVIWQSVERNNISFLSILLT